MDPAPNAASSKAPQPNGSDSGQSPALPQGTFTSILPAVEDVLQLIYGLAEGDAAATTDAIVAKAKEVNSQLAAMRKAADELPGGHLSLEAVTAVTRVLDEQAQRKRAVLKAFCETPTPVADAMNPPASVAASAEGSKGATPAV